MNYDLTFYGALWLTTNMTKFGNKTRSLRTKLTKRKRDSFARILIMPFYGSKNPCNLIG